MSDAFDLLCDILDSDHFIFVTGAGASFDLRLASDPTKQLPSWVELLTRIRADVGGALGADDERDLDVLLDRSVVEPESVDLITAASILARADPVAFDVATRAAGTAEPGTTSDLHRWMWKVGPRGIVTFNYDTGHEVAADELGLGIAPLVPQDERRFAEVVRNRFGAPFLLKAHGSIDDTNELVLSAESYQRVQFRSPEYRAFVRTLLADFHIVFLGFGMSDPDFDSFLDEMRGDFGGPLHDHVAVMGPGETDRRMTRLRHRYGVVVHRLAGWGERDDDLQRAADTPGPRLQVDLARCFDDDEDVRGTAHAALRQLGRNGRQVASQALTEQLAAARGAKDWWRAAEAAYSLGEVDAVGNKALLMELVEAAEDADVMGRALTVLRRALDPTDLPRLQAWRDRFASTPPSGTNPGRIVTYLDYYLVYVPAKFDSGRRP